jgi:hypothetical protein
MAPFRPYRPNNTTTSQPSNAVRPETVRCFFHSDLSGRRGTTRDQKLEDLPFFRSKPIRLQP